MNIYVIPNVNTPGAFYIVKTDNVDRAFAMLGYSDAQIKKVGDTYGFSESFLEAGNIGFIN